MTSMRRELRRMNRAMDKYIGLNGEGVLWYEYAGVQATDYMAEGTRRYLAPIAVPVLWVTETEDVESGTAEGRRLTPTLRFATTVEKLIKAGLSDPHDSDRHINDLVQYQRTLYNVGSFQLRGRMAREDVVVGVNGIKVFPDEDLVFDQLPPGILPNSTRRPKPVIEDDSNWQVFPDHELPARQTP